MKKVALITGVNGQDGAYLAQFLLKKNYKVIGTTRTISKSKNWRLKRLKIDKKIIICKLNLNNKKNIDYVFNKYKFDEFYNLAGHSIVTTSFKDYLNIADSKEWSHLWITGNYFVYSISVSLFAIFIGSLIDKFSAKKLVTYSLVPLIISLFFLISSREAYTVVPYMFFLGLSSGFTYTSHPAIIAELYGTQFLGSIKSLLSALTVFGSAIGPVIFGGLLDLDLTIETILLYFSIYSLICTFLFIFALRNKYN